MSGADTKAADARTGVWTIVVGGGTGQRFGRPKQYEELGDRRVIDWSADVAASASEGIVVVVPPADADAEGATAGGDTRSESVRAGLAQVPVDAEIICVHDAARPLATKSLYERVVAAVRGGADAAIPGVAVRDTIKLLADPFDESIGVLGSVVDTPDRSRIVAVQTPQAFRAEALRRAHSSGGDATDDAGLVEEAGGLVVVVTGELANLKITEPNDLAWVSDRLHMVHDVDRVTRRAAES